MKVGESPKVEKQGVKLFQAIASQPIIKLLTETNPSDYYRILWNSCTTTSIWLGSLSYEDTLDRLLQILGLTGFGDAMVTAPGPHYALITLNEVASLFKERKLKCGVRVREVASRAISIDPEIMLLEAMRTMCEHNVRRLFLRGKEYEFISDRGILAYLFSPKGLQVARDLPESWTEVKVSDIQTMKAQLVSPQALVEDVGCMIDTGRDIFMLSDGNSLVSMWDLVIKPWKAGQLRVSL